MHIGITEYEVADFIRERLKNENMYVADGPVVAVNAHSADPHFEPTRKHTDLFKEGDWVLIGRYAGARFSLEDDAEVRIINDDEVIGTILDPDDIKAL